MKKILTFFILSFAITYVVIHFSFKMLSENYYDEMAYETEIMHESVKERFDLYLNSSHIIGILAANIFSSNDPLKDEYERLGKQVTEKFHEILGFNLLDRQGVIIRVFPLNENKKALLKVTQNFPKILESVQKQSSYWFSPPFHLYQGDVGFAFYVPIYKDKQFSGWIAPVISNKLFLERFMSSKLLSKYELVVRDIETGRDYFSTSPLPKNSSVHLQHTSQIFGRPVVFYSWPIYPDFDFKIPWYVCFLLALVLSAMATMTYRLFDQRKVTKNQLEKIKALINFTAEEASISLTGIYKELNLMGKETGYVSTDKVSKYVSYISNLLDQISVSEKMSHTNQILDFQNNQLYPLLEEQLELFSDKFKVKAINVKVDESPLKLDFPVWSNKWLLCHSILGNILRNLVYYAPAASDIKITFLQDEKTRTISFYHVLDTGPARDLLHDEILDRCLSIAREVTKMSNGQLDVIERPADGRTIVLTFNK